MDLTSDEQLMQNYGQGGDVAAFDLLYQRYRKPLFAFIYQKVPEAAHNEVFQEVWESVIKQAAHYQPPAPQLGNNSPASQHATHQPFRAYLYTIARRRIADHWRSLPVGHEPDFDLDNLQGNSTPPLAHQQQTDKKIILMCVALLPKKQQEVFMLKQSGLKVAEMSSVLACSFDAVKSRIRIAYQQLRECWEKNNG